MCFSCFCYISSLWLISKTAASETWIKISLIINQLNYLKQWKKLLPLLSIFPFTRCFFRVQKKIIPVLKIPRRVIRVAQNNILSYIFSVFVCKTDNNCGKSEENCKIVFFTRFFCVLLCANSRKKWKGCDLTLSNLITY